MPTDYTPTPISLDPESLRLLEVMMDSEDRNRSSMVRRLIKERARELGILKIENLPAPKGANPVPVVTMHKKG